MSISLAKSSWLARKFWVNTKNQLNSLRSFNWSLSFVPDISEMSKSPWLLGHPSLHDVACCACAFWWSTFPPQENVCEWKLYSPPPSFVLYSSIYPYLPERHLPKSGSKENEAHQCRCDIFFLKRIKTHFCYTSSRDLEMKTLGKALGGPPVTPLLKDYWGIVQDMEHCVLY